MKKYDRQKLYLMINEFNLLKVGISTDPRKRRSALQNTSGVSVSLVKSWDIEGIIGTAREVEQKLHKKFKDCRKKGEWFNVDEKELTNYINKAVSNTKRFLRRSKLKPFKGCTLKTCCAIKPKKVVVKDYPYGSPMFLSGYRFYGEVKSMVVLIKKEFPRVDPDTEEFMDALLESSYNVGLPFHIKGSIERTANAVHGYFSGRVSIEGLEDYRITV